MYHVYIKTASSFDGRKLLGEFSDYEVAYEAVEAELDKNKDLKYIIEETTGSVNIYGELVVDVIEEN